jgi:hypothetical protein
LPEAIAVAVARGCRHYATLSGKNAPEGPCRTVLPDEELVILLLVGEHPYDLQAVRCAAQLARSPNISPARLAFLAKREKATRALAHIARAGIAHDESGKTFWNEVLLRTGEPAHRNEPALPHWSRFVSMPGLQRHGPVPPHWLVPS